MYDACLIDILKHWPINEPVPTISLRQPWASAVLYFGKDVENRTRWPFKYRGPLIIHASKSQPFAEDVRAFLDCAREDGATDEELRGISPERLPADVAIGGYIVGVVNLVDVFCDTRPAPPDHPIFASPWRLESSPYSLYLENAIAVQPLCARGSLGLFKTPYDIAASLTPLR